MHRSMLDIEGADARAGGMSISSGSGASWRRARHGRGMPRPPSRHRGSRRHRVRASDSSRPRLVLVVDVRDCASCPFGRRLSPPCLVHDQAFKGAIEDGAGKSGAHLRLDAALEAPEDGHVAGLQVRHTSWWDEAQHDVWDSGLHGGQGLAGVDAGHVPEKDPRLSFSARVQGDVHTRLGQRPGSQRVTSVFRSNVISASQ